MERRGSILSWTPRRIREGTVLDAKDKLQKVLEEELRERSPFEGEGLER